MKNANPLKPCDHGKSSNHIETLQRRYTRQPPALDPPAPSITVGSMAETNHRHHIGAALFILSVLLTPTAFADVSHGTPEAATNYYRGLAKEIAFSTPENIFVSTLDNVASYLGYDGVTGAGPLSLDYVLVRWEAQRDDAPQVRPLGSLATTPR